MARWTGENDVGDVLSAGVAWRTRCLEADGSILSDRHLWTPANLDALGQIFRDNPINGNDASFVEKLHVQLTGAPPETIQLAAEVVWLVLLFPHASSMQPLTKRQRVIDIWTWSGEAVPPNPTCLSEATLTGVGNAGTFYMTNVPDQFGFTIEAASRWKKRPADQRIIGTDEEAAWRFADWIDAIFNAEKRPVRHAILYFCFPDFFERNVSTAHRLEIFLALRGKLPNADLPQEKEPQGRVLDQALLAIRRRLAVLLTSHDIDFYRSPLRAMWQVERRDERRKVAVAALQGVLDNYNLEINQTGIKKRRLIDTRPVDTKVGFWSDPNDATNKPLRWILQVDLTGPEPRAQLPDSRGASRMAFINSGKGVSGAVIIRIIPAMKLDADRYEFFETWEWLMMLCFLPALEAGSAAQLLEEYDPEAGTLNYKGKPQPYVAAGLIGLNDPDSIYVGESADEVRQITYTQATTALRSLLNVDPSVDLDAEETVDG